MCLETLRLRGGREGRLSGGRDFCDYPKGIQRRLERKAESIGMACEEVDMEGSGPEGDVGGRGQN